MVQAPVASTVAAAGNTTATATATAAGAYARPLFGSRKQFHRVCRAISLDENRSS